MIEGAAEMAAVMRQLPDQLARNALAAAARAGAQQLQGTTYAYLSLAMNRSAREDDVVIKQRRPEKSELIQAVYDVGPPKRKPWLRWLHDGTAPHIISAVTKYGTRRGIRDVAYGAREGSVLASRDAIFGVDVFHPGQPSRPWLEQANFAARDAVFTEMASKLRDALAKQVRRLVSDKYRGQQIGRFFRSRTVSSFRRAFR